MAGIEGGNDQGRPPGSEGLPPLVEGQRREHHPWNGRTEGREDPETWESDGWKGEGRGDRWSEGIYHIRSYKHATLIKTPNVVT